MFRSKKPETESDIDKAIHSAHTFLAGMSDTSDNYAKCVENLAKLYKMKESTKDPSTKYSKDAILAACASLGGIALILSFETIGRGMITSKSLGFVHKARI